MKLIAAVVILSCSLGTAVLHAQTLPRDHNRIDNVVVIFQENRTPDNLFHGLPGADIANTGVNSKGDQITLQPVPLANNFDLGHGHVSFVNMYDNGNMDGADKVSVNCNKGAKGCPPANPQFMYVNPSDVDPYFQMAEQYTFGDRMFQTNQGPSFPAHQFIISGTSAPTSDSDLFAAENPGGVLNANNKTGCTAPSNETVRVIDRNGSEAQKIYPCFEHLTLMDLLDFRGISWRYYAPSAGSIWTGPNAIQHLRFGQDWDNVILNPPQILTDISDGRLANVTWVMPSGRSSDHPGSNDGSGPSWVASIVNAVGNSQYWDNTVIIITWDDWGGWYDHVAPRVINSYEYGLRVPLIVVSPFAKQGYVSHDTYDFGSILKFIEEVYRLGSLGYADRFAENDLSDCLDFHRHNRFQKIKAPLGAKYFLNDKRAPTDPDDD
jgi:phospholipase C